VGVVIGAAFGKIVTALVEDIVMPLVSLVMPSGDWRSNGLVLRQGVDSQSHVVLRYGDLLGALVDFLIVAFVLFIVVSKVIRAAERKLGAVDDAPTMRDCPYCCEKVPLKASRCRACTSQLTA